MTFSFFVCNFRGNKKGKNMKDKDIVVKIVHKVDGKIVVQNVKDVIKKQVAIAVAHAQ